MQPRDEKRPTLPVNPFIVSTAARFVIFACCKEGQGLLLIGVHSDDQGAVLCIVLTVGGGERGVQSSELVFGLLL